MMERFGDVWVEPQRIVAVKGHFKQGFVEGENGLMKKGKEKLPTSVTLKLDTGDTLMIDELGDAHAFWEWWLAQDI